MSAGPTPTPTTPLPSPHRFYNLNEFEGWDTPPATIIGHDSPGWLTATIVVGTIVGSALVGAYGFLWICGRMLRSVGV
jgi:hypothetical protein